LCAKKNIEIVRRVPRRGSKATKLIAIGADHGGFKMKQELKAFLSESGHRVHDFGTDSEDAVDYPDFAHAVARASPRERLSWALSSMAPASAAL